MLLFLQVVIIKQFPLSIIYCTQHMFTDLCSNFSPILPGLPLSVPTLTLQTLNFANLFLSDLVVG